MPSAVADQLRAVHEAVGAWAGVTTRPAQPDSGWVTTSVEDPGGPDGVVALFALSYDRARQAADRRAR